MRTPLPHPDAGRPTRPMPFEQLRALVCLLIESEEEALWEREPRPPTHHPVEPGLPSQPRVSTLDEVIASLPRR